MDSAKNEVTTSVLMAAWLSMSVNIVSLSPKKLLIIAVVADILAIPIPVVRDTWGL